MRTRLRPEPPRTLILWALVVLTLSVGVTIGVTRTPGNDAVGGVGQPLIAPDGEEVRDTVDIQVWPRGPGHRAVSWQVTCPGSARCPALVRARPLLLSEPRGSCPRRRAGVAEAMVVGRIAGRYVSAFLEQRTGCEVERWRALAPILRVP